jgi:hypothetical protein
MSKEFIEAKVGSYSLEKAVRQQQQLSYLTTSEIQENINVEYFENYIDKKYYTSEDFLNWIKNIFRDQNFLSFAKYFRKPNPSSKLINARIKEPLSRVFFSEDSYFNYTISGEDVEYPPELDDGFEERLFNSVIFNHNDIIVHDLFGVNNPIRFFLDIDKVVAIEVIRKKITQLAYSATTTINGEVVKGYVYLDSERYAFYSVDIELLFEETHDLGVCPATFVVNDDFDKDPIIKKSIFSYLRSDLEEYTFLKTLQKMTDANGAIPIVTKIKTKELTGSGEDFDAKEKEPMSVEQLGSQTATETRASAGSAGQSVLQPGTVITVPAIEKADGGVDVELSKNFLTFHYTPVKALEYLNTRIKEIEQNIITSAIGDYSEGNEASMTELQVSKGYVSKEDKLRWLSNTMSASRQASDWMMLSLAHGRNQVTADTFYGSDFFLETQSKIYDMFNKSPNSIERTNLLIRLTQRRNMFNRDKAQREVILYKMLPYSSDEDFEISVDNEMVGNIEFQLQTRFNYWIARFEAFYGSITAFWNNLENEESEKIVIINNLITNLIQTQNGKETNS